MDYREAINRIWNHANLPPIEATELTADDSFVWAIRSAKQGGARIDLSRYCADIKTATRWRANLPAASANSPSQWPPVQHPSPYSPLSAQPGLTLARPSRSSGCRR